MVQWLLGPHDTLPCVLILLYRLVCFTVPCDNLTDPESGNVTCPSTTSVFQGTCTYYCNQLDGNSQPSCTADGTWSSEPVTCTILTCNDPDVEMANSQSVGDCSSVTYGPSCLLNCSSGCMCVMM